MAIRQSIPPLPQDTAIVDPKTGLVTIAFQQWWQQLTQNGDSAFDEIDETTEELATKVPQTRLISTTAPIAGGGSLENDLTLTHANSGVSADTYGDATHVAQITVDAKGHVTSVTDVAISGGGGSSQERTRVKPVVADFTLENAGTASMADGTYGIVLTAPSATVNGRFIRYTAGLPGASWTLTVRAQPLSPDNNVVHTRALVCRNSTSGRIITFADSSATTVGANRWSSYTAHNASIFSYTGARADMPWRRIVSNGTTLSFYSSADGEDWQLVGTETIATYLTATGGTLDQVGFGLFIGAAPTVTQANIFQSFELT